MPGTFSRLLRAEKRVGSVYYELSHDTLVEPIRLSKWEHNVSIIKTVAPFIIISGLFLSFIFIFDLLVENQISVLISAIISFFLVSGSAAFGFAFEKYVTVMQKKYKMIRGLKEAEQFTFEFRMDQAIEKYNKILRIEPKNAMAIVKLGELLEGQRKYETAMQVYKKAIENGITDGRVYTGYWKMLFKTGKEEKAFISLHESIKCN